MENVIVQESISESDYTPASTQAIDENLREYVEAVLGEGVTNGMQWIHSKNKDDVPPLDTEKTGLINTHRINDIRWINKYFEQANLEMENGQYLVAVMETKGSRKKRILNKFPKVLSYPYYVLDFVLKRVFPKWKPTRRIYFLITKGRNRVMSLTEALGRLVCCGFEIVDYSRSEYRSYIIAKKIKPPVYDMQPTYGVLIKLRRIGLGGRMFHVYKLRTMHPYSEYLQDYIFQKYNLEAGGKFKNDFRTTSWGAVIRKYWIDELPMFINFFRREMKLVGVRPLSRHYFELYPEDLKEMRTKVKPGLVPPYYADMPKGLDEILESERAYLLAYRKKPFRTDLRYFFKAWRNILFRGARSK